VYRHIDKNLGKLDFNDKNNTKMKEREKRETMMKIKPSPSPAARDDVI